ncbi:tyrosine-type recombinase/integrase [Glaciimonas sp. CA11.2]|uniref:tyrosine-type recombinase/integrase n=1 Tax=Glaciimonas sp. CA11.2 TaxID=3048601 RepID=UPI002AB5BE01|nr:tyrosine-type recombinase/integrase [Glaciimonas sp. CA11.2]MDY7544631.1 tyrosine-type recombinase/integrase [Glaciimonas sp. CA11.2]MEB0164591.1 tyrosine-type recombinase/integrase [Glaciimonas sp. CA11.2]
MNLTKNGTSQGVPLNHDAVAVLQKQIGQYPQSCFTYRGKPIRRDVTNTAWHNALKRVEIEDFRFHDPRNTWASWHRQPVTSCEELEYLGSRKSRVMVDRNAKLATEHLQAAAARIEEGRQGILSERGACDPFWKYLALIRAHHVFDVHFTSF